jgi:hypothetical protein
MIQIVPGIKTTDSKLSTPSSGKAGWLAHVVHRIFQFNFYRRLLEANRFLRSTDLVGSLVLLDKSPRRRLCLVLPNPQAHAQRSFGES